MGAVNMPVKTLVITGAGGYLGRYAVAAARARGHAVIAMVRRAESAADTWQGDAGITLLSHDLAGPGNGLRQALAGADAVLHIAASLYGDDAAHARDTLYATEQLYEVIAGLEKPIPVVLASSMAVYQGRAGLIDETSPLEPLAQYRDAYCRAKLAQEAIAAEATAQGISSRLLRLGAIYGPDRLWNAHMGLRLGPVLLRLAGRGELPLLYAPHAAQALVRAVETPLAAATAEALNVVDDNLPTAHHYLAALPPEARPRLILPLPWQIFLPFARLARAMRLPLPGLLRPETLLARMASRRYTNTLAKSVLVWAPATRLDVALETALNNKATP